MKEIVLNLLQEPHLRELYANTYYSLLDRLDESGYLEESFVPGRYPGNFARSTGAFVFCMAEAGQVDAAERALRFVLDSMVKNDLNRPPHVLGRPGEKQELDMTNQLDGTGHILSAYAELILRYGRESLYADYWPFMSRMLDLHTDAPYFFASDICNFPVAKINLFLNTLFEHSREERYWSCFDLLTQSFMGASLEKMIRVAKAHGLDASRWERRLSWLREGIDRNLTRIADGEKIYAEMRLPDSNNGSLFQEQGWVSLSPIAADWEALEPSVMEATTRQLLKQLRREDPACPGLYYLDKDGLPGNVPCLETIGKGVGWEMEEARRREDFARVAETLRFLLAEHKKPLYGECMFFRDGAWQTRDEGNAEQCLWWCWAMGRLRRTLSLPAEPSRDDITIAFDFRKREHIQRAIGG